MSRFSKFKKRIKSLTIDGFDIKFSKIPNTTHHGDAELPFRILYKDKVIFEYICGRNPIDYECWSKISQITDFIDGYFDIKHDIAFNKTADELIEIFLTDVFYKTKHVKKVRTWELKYNQPKYDFDEYSSHFKQYVVNDLLLILKLCDRRVGKRGLKKLKNIEMKPIFKEILND